MFDKISEKIAKIIVNGVTHLVKDVGNNDVVIRRNRIIVNGVEISSSTNINGNIKIKWEGGLVNLNTDRSVECGDISGNVDCGGSVQCGSIGGNVDCGGSVQSGHINGSVDAGGSVISR